MLRASTLSTRKRAQRRFTPALGDLATQASCERRFLAAPIFTPSSSWKVRASASGPGNTSEDPLSAVAADHDTETEVDIGGTNLTNTYTATGTVNTILQTLTGQDGASSIHINSTHTASETADINYFNGLMTNGQFANANSFTEANIDAATGGGAATWTITDPVDPSNTSGHVTAVFDLHWTNQVNANNGFLVAAPSLIFISNQISVYVNTEPDGNGGLEIWDNTTPFGPTLVVADPNAGTGMNPTSFDASYQTGQDISLPSGETISYDSFVGAATVPGANAAPGSYSNQQSFKWDFFLTNG